MNIDAMDCEEMSQLMLEHVMELPAALQDEGVMEGFKPSMNDRHAFEALEHLQMCDWHITMRLDVSQPGPDRGKLFSVVITDGTNTGGGLGETFPIAFSRAALKFVFTRKGVARC